jgi:hypothetical protein
MSFTKRTTHTVCLFGALILAGCATAPDPIIEARRDEIRRTIPTCSTEKQCNVKWEAAQLWVVKNAGYKIQTATSVLIETYNASNSRVELAAQVTKEPLGGGRYRFNLRVRCDNIFRCYPNVLDAMLDFNRTINGIEP